MALRLPRSAGERRRRPLYMCSLTFQKNGSHWVFACDFAPHGKTIVSASADKTLKIWDVESGKCLTTLEGHWYLCHCGRQIVGKTVNVTVLPTPTPRSPGERRSRPCRFNVSYSINTVAARTTRIAPANFMIGARSRRPTLPALCRDTGILVLYARCCRLRPLHGQRGRGVDDHYICVP